MEPPAGGGTDRAGRLVFEHIERHDPARGARGGIERGVIGEAKIVAEPDERGHVPTLGARRGAGALGECLR